MRSNREQQTTTAGTVLSSLSTNPRGVFIPRGVYIKVRLHNQVHLIGYGYYRYTIILESV